MFFTLYSIWICTYHVINHKVNWLGTYLDEQRKIDWSGTWTCDLPDCAGAVATELSSSFPVEPRHVNSEVAGPALVNISLFIQIYVKMYPVSFPCGLLHDIYRKKLYPLTASSQVVS